MGLKTATEENVGEDERTGVAPCGQVCDSCPSRATCPEHSPDEGMPIDLDVALAR